MLKTETGTVGYFTKVLFKFYLSLKEKFDPSPKVLEEESYCVKICLKLLESNLSKLTFAPVSESRFIVNEDKQMFISIHNRTITVTNHVYSYSVYIQENNDYANVVKKFDSTLEEERQSIQDEIRRNIKHSLQTILNGLD